MSPWQATRSRSTRIFCRGPGTRSSVRRTSTGHTAPSLPCRPAGKNWVSSRQSSRSVRDVRGTVRSPHSSRSVPPTAGGLMRRSLRSHDQDARAQAIEALDSLGDRRLGRALTACLEAASEETSPDPMAALERLTQDDDSWIARLSKAVRASLTTDPHEATMTTHDRVSTEFDRMLLLRRIPAVRRPRAGGPATDRAGGDGAGLSGGQRAHASRRSRR